MPVQISCDAPSVPSTDPRVGRSRVAVLGAALDLFLTEGWDAVTHLRVAERTGLSRTTVYRHWPDRSTLLLETLMLFGVAEELELTGDLRTDLTMALGASHQLLSDERTAPLLAILIDRAMRESEFKELKADLTARHTNNLRRILTQARAAGSVHPDLDVEECVDLLIGPVAYRGLLSAEPLSNHFIHAIVDNFMQAHGVIRQTPRRRRARSASGQSRTL